MSKLVMPSVGGGRGLYQHADGDYHALHRGETLIDTADLGGIDDVVLGDVPAKPLVGSGSCKGLATVQKGSVLGEGVTKIPNMLLTSPLLAPVTLDDMFVRDLRRLENSALSIDNDGAVLVENMPAPECCGKLSILFWNAAGMGADALGDLLNCCHTLMARGGMLFSYSRVQSVRQKSYMSSATGIHVMLHTAEIGSEVLR